MSNVKYHIGLDGIPKVCKATKKPCPYGGIGAHFQDLESAQNCADSLNSQLSKLAQTGNFGVAVEGEYVIPTQDTQAVILQLQNFKYNMIQLDAAYKKAREDVRLQLEEVNAKNLKTPIANISSVKESTRNKINPDLLREAGIYDEYSKEIEFSEYTQVSSDKTGHERKFTNFKNRLNKYDGSTVDLDLSVSSDGEVTYSEQTLKAIEELKDFQDTIEKAKQLEKDIKGQLMDIMKDRGIDQIKVGATSLDYVEAGTRQTVDTTKLKEDGIYDDYKETINVAPSIRVKYLS